MFLKGSGSLATSERSVSRFVKSLPWAHRQSSRSRFLYFREGTAVYWW
jgi:hypothetical protein